MGSRRRARELALQALFYFDFEKGETEEMLSLFCENFSDMMDEEAKPFFLTLVQGVKERQSEIDLLLSTCSRNWRVARMPFVDRNIMRAAAFELLECPDIPASVTINEAVEIGKRFGTRESAPFINGVLDRVRLHQESQ
ncbi:MAG: transcription antitermination factor NusB [Desulfobacteraceae bacterium]